MGRAFGDNPLTWSLPLYRAWGIQVRIHVLFIIFVVAQLIFSFVTGGAFGPAYMFITLASLFGIVLLHEYGHCIACRRVGGDADEIMLWPLGGLAMCMPPDTWRAHLVTVVGGPMVNVLLVPVFGLPLLLLSGSWESVIFDPFAPSSAILSLSASSGPALWGLITLWSLYYVNWILLAFNVFVPMYPMDGGRIFQAILWARIGHTRSMRISLKLGIVFAIILVVFGMLGSPLLMGIGLFGGIVCWVEHRRLTAPDVLGGPSIDLSAAFDHPEREQAEPGPSRRELKQQEREQKLQEEIDRVLEKIAKQGMGSLTRAEKKLLQQETERKRGGER